MPSWLDMLYDIASSPCEGIEKRKPPVSDRVNRALVLFTGCPRWYRSRIRHRMLLERGMWRDIWQHCRSLLLLPIACPALLFPTRFPNPWKRAFSLSRQNYHQPVTSCLGRETREQRNRPEGAKQTRATERGEYRMQQSSW